MHAEEPGGNARRVSCRKRTRGSCSFSTLAEKGDITNSMQQLQNPVVSSAMADINSAEYCSDNEDLFGDYDSILNDSSFLAKLDNAEQNEEQVLSGVPCTVPVDTQSPDPTSFRPSKVNIYNPTGDSLTNSILDDFEDPTTEYLLDSKNEVQNVENQKRSNCKEGNHTSTPLKYCQRLMRNKKETEIDGESEMKQSPISNRRESRTHQLKKAMLCNAASPSSVSRTIALKDAVVREEMYVAKQTIETVSEGTTDLGPFHGLPSKVKDLIYRIKGITQLYEWQETCLGLDCIKERKNLIFSLPTSGGKTLVAEILILREILCRKKDCLFILPYVSLVQEKVRGLASFGLELDFMVEEYAGSKGRFPPLKRRNKQSVYVTTIEKAHSLVNSLIGTNRLDALGLIVVDELHMLGDGSRGAIIETTLAKVIYMSKTIQIIGMSATLGNIQDIQTFLRAENYTDNFRPVQLKEYVKMRDTIFEVEPKEEECLKFSRFLKPKYSNVMQKADPDHIIALVTEIIPVHSCLVFCPTKKNCENIVAMICKYLKKEFLQHKDSEKALLLRELRNSGSGSVCPVLKKTVPYGLAYHHSGLTNEERHLIEEAYYKGTLCLLACTSTLAAGINLPARRVILRSPYVATDYINRSQYKQMVGRAGRAGIDSFGESILIIQEKDKIMAKTLVSAPVENCYSNLLNDDGKGILSLILSIIGLNIANSVEAVRDFLHCTLLYVQEKHLCLETSLLDRIQECVGILRDKALITSHHTDGLQVTKLGKATYKGSVDITYCDVLYGDLSKGLEGLLLNSYLHLVYLITPYDVISQCKPDWLIFLTQFTQLSAAEQKMFATVGVPESFVARKAGGQAVKKNVNHLVVKRLYLALVLYSLLKTTNIWNIAEKFQLSRGFVQTLLSSSSAFCSCVLHFTEELEEFWPFKALLTELSRRLTHCVTAELIPLMEVAGVMEFRAKQLYNAGYKTLAHLANADPGVLANTIENLYKKQANQIVASAMMLLNEKAAALQEEVDELLTKPLDLP